MTTFLLRKTPNRYAILLHTWEPGDQEGTLQGFINGAGKTRNRKINFCAEQAAYLKTDRLPIMLSFSLSLSGAFTRKQNENGSMYNSCAQGL
jgi:hypothetical protein